MKDVFIVLAAVSVFVLGFFIMKKLDTFLANNRRHIDEEIAENQLLLAFDNPMITDLLTPILEEFSKANPECRIRLFFGTAKEICEKTEDGGIDFGFIRSTDFKDQGLYTCAKITAKPTTLCRENTPYPLEPLTPNAIQVCVIRKKDSDNAFADSFSDALLLFSKQYSDDLKHIR